MTDARLEREREHDRRIADRAEQIWNWDSPAGRRRAARRAELLVRHAALGPGRLALELGCGTGLFLEKAAGSGALIHAMDLSADLLARAGARRLANARLLVGDAHRMPYADASFDAVYGSSILHHLQLDGALRECRRVLKRGGRIAFAEPNLWNPQIAFMYLLGPRARFGLSPDEMAFTRARARRALEEAGFTEILVRPMDFLHPALPPALIELVAGLGDRLEAWPVVRELGGSLLLHARKE